MNSKDKIEQKLHNLSDAIGSDDKLVGNVMSRIDKKTVTHTSQAKIQHIWRIIKKNPLTKFAAAAVIIIAVIVSSTYFGVKVNMTNIALAEVVENMKKMPWTHVITESETSAGKQISESWTCFDPFLYASKGSHVSTIFLNHTENKEYLYNPDDPYSNKINIIPISPFFELTKSQKSPFDMVALILEQARNHTSKIKKEKSNIEGIDVEIINIISENSDTILYRDIKRNLLIRIDNTIIVRNENSTKTSKKSTSKTQLEYPAKDTSKTSPKVEIHNYKRFFDYPDEGPQNIYDLGAPRDAEVDNYCPTGDVADIFAQVRQHINNSFEGYFAIVLETQVNDNKPEQQKITLIRPRDTSNGPFLWTDIRSLAWFHPSEFVLNWNTFDTDYETLSANQEHEGLIGFRVLQTQKSSIKRTKIDEYWLDPEQDYIIREHYRFESHMNRYWDSTKKTITLETKQTPDGQWYPSNISYEWNYADNSGQHKQHIDKQIIFKKEPVFQDDNFQIDFIFD